jgi:hypothetical protein
MRHTRKFVVSVAGMLMAGTMLAAPAFAGGANQSGPYDPGCVCTPTANGNGHGPDKIAGSVGNANDKNPPGQVKKFDASPDNGYECDGNSGVGRGNPAHESIIGEGFC